MWNPIDAWNAAHGITGEDTIIIVAEGMIIFSIFAILAYICDAIGRRLHPEKFSNVSRRTRS